MRISDWSSDVCSSDLCSNFSRYRSVCCSPWFLILTPSSRKASNSGSSRAVSTRRLAIGPPMMSIALRRLGSAIALWALASKSWEVTCMLMVMPPSVFLADGGRIGHAGQHLGDMAHLYAAALALQLAGHVEQARSEEHTSELQSLMRISYAVFCLKKNKKITHIVSNTT